MKNTYVKPDLFYESFVLSQHIAGCNLKITNYTEANTCTASGSVSDGNEILTSDFFFTKSNGACEVELDAYCYMNGTVSSMSMNS